MEDMGFPWCNIINQHQDFEESFIFGSGNIFLNSMIQDLQKTDSNSMIIAATASNRQQLMGSDDQLANPIASASFVGDSRQYRSQNLADGKPCITNATVTRVTSLESLDCGLISSPTCINNNNRIISAGVSSANSVSKTETDDVSIVSKCSSDKKPISGCYVDDNNHRPSRFKRSRSDPVSSTINFRQASESDETDSEAIAQMKEMIYRAAAFRPVSLADDEEFVKPRRKNVRISNDPQTVAARQRRERISDRIRVLQKLVPGGNKMDTASMLDEAANYLKFLRSQVKELEQFAGQKQHQLEYDYGTTTTAHSTTSQIQIQNCNVTLGVPFPSMQAHFLLPHHQQLNLP